MKYVLIHSVIVMTALALSGGCSTSQEQKGVYDKERDDRPLEVPPDLSRPDQKSAMHIPYGLASRQAPVRSGEKQSALAPRQFGPARLVRDGSLVWLEVDAAVEDLWTKVQAFFRGLGFKINHDDIRLGLMETDWLENRADVPTNWFSKMLRKLYSTGLMDMYRIRLERGEQQGQTRVFISHRGLKEVYTEGESSEDVLETKGWQMRRPDADLEMEMLQRFAIFVGGDQADVKQQVEALQQEQQFATVIQQQGVMALSINETFVRSWRRIGIALDRMGIAVEDRNRSSGVYYIRLPKALLQEEQGWLAKLFSSKQAEISEDRYVLKVVEQDQRTLVGVLDRQGQQVSATLADQLLKQLKSHLL